MKYFYVPAPIYQVLKANRFEGREFLDINKLLSILSPEDLSFYLWCNLYPEKVLPKCIPESGRNVLMYGGVTVDEAKAESTSVVSPPWHRVESDAVRTELNRCMNDYSVNGRPAQLDLEGWEPSCEIFWLEGGQVTLFTHIPVVDALMDPCEREHGFYLRLAQQQLQFNPIHDLAAEPWFHAYLVSKQQCV